jgi:hypothetical protein
LAESDDAVVREFVEAGGVAQALPDLDNPPEGNAFLAVALSRVAVDAAIAELGREPALELLAELAATTAPSQSDLDRLTAWYLAAVSG